MANLIKAQEARDIANEVQLRQTEIDAVSNAIRNEATGAGNTIDFTPSQENYNELLQLLVAAGFTVTEMKVTDETEADASPIILEYLKISW